MCYLQKERALIKGRGKIKTEIVIDENASEPKILIITNKLNDEITRLYGRLSGDRRLKCFGERGMELIEEEEIITVYAERGGVFLKTANNTYRLHERLYEVEERLDKSLFVRISKSEIVNSRKILRLNIKMSGTIGIELENGAVSFVSRRFVPEIKKFFGL